MPQPPLLFRGCCKTREEASVGAVIDRAYNAISYTLTQSNTYLSELASNPIQFGSNPMGSVSDSTEFGSALRQFDLAQMVCRPETNVSGLDRHRSRLFRHRSGPEQVLKNQSTAANDDFSMSIEPAGDRFQTSESSFRAVDVSPQAIPRSFRPGSISIRAGRESLQAGSRSIRRRENRGRGVRGSPVNR
jgi:hypothetical protein